MSATPAAAPPAASPAPAVTDREVASAVRALAVDAVQAANSGHPGAPMGMADAATAPSARHLRCDAADPAWPDRDRVLSAGHGSTLLYALLHLTGAPGTTAAELRRFRRWGALTPRHPEHGRTPGAETATGPLGRGVATAVAVEAAVEGTWARRPGERGASVGMAGFGASAPAERLYQEFGIAAEAAAASALRLLGREDEDRGDDNRGDDNQGEEG